MKQLMAIGLVLAISGCIPTNKYSERDCQAHMDFMYEQERIQQQMEIGGSVDSGIQGRVVDSMMGGGDEEIREGIDNYNDVHMVESEKLAEKAKENLRKGFPKFEECAYILEMAKYWDSKLLPHPDWMTGRW